MLNLTIIRHAKSSWKEENLTDFERPLNKRGMRDAPKIGSYLVENGIKPDLILCSTAKRAKETFEHLDEVARFAADVKFLDELYLIGQGRLMKLLREQSDKFKHICVIAHNPGLHEFVLNFIKDATSEAMSDLGYNFPTAALAYFEIDIKRWSALEPHSANLVNYVTPSKLPG